MAILGHRTLAEAQKYIDDYNRDRAAVTGMARLARVNAAGRGTKEE